MREQECKVCGDGFGSDFDADVCSNACEIRGYHPVFHAMEEIRFMLKNVTGDDFRTAMEGLIADLGLK